jgi:DNA-binding MarR family transcriptional regulator
MIPPSFPFGLRAQQIIAAFYRAGYPIEEIADALGLAPRACQELVDAMRRAGWILRRPRGAHERIQIDTVGHAREAVRVKLGPMRLDETTEQVVRR